MQRVSIREARQHIGRLLDAVETGERIIIMRRGKPVATLQAVDKDEITVRFPSHQTLRSQIPPATTPGSVLLRELRDERG